MGLSFKNKLAPTEVFYTRKYKKYHARGKVFLNYTRVFENLKDVDKYQGVYTLGFYAFVNDEYLKKASKTDPDDKSSLYALIGANKREYEKTLSNILRNTIVEMIKVQAPDLIASNSFQPERLTSRVLLAYANKPTTMTSLKIPDKEIIDSKIAAKQPVIPVGIYMEPVGIIDRATKKLTKPFRHNLYHAFSSNLATALKHYPDGRYTHYVEWSSYFYDQMAATFGYPKISKIDFTCFLKEISDLGYEWVTTKTANRSLINKINTKLEIPATEDCYLSEFCNSISFSLIDDMLDAGAVSECQYCGLLFPFEKGKK